MSHAQPQHGDVKKHGDALHAIRETNARKQSTVDVIAAQDQGRHAASVAAHLKPVHYLRFNRPQDTGK